MTAVYSPDLVPQLQPGVVRWQPRPPAYERRALEQRLALTAAATALAVVALGVVALGALAIGRVSKGGPRIHRLDMDHLRLGRIRRLRRPF